MHMCTISAFTCWQEHVGVQGALLAEIGLHCCRNTGYIGLPNVACTRVLTRYQEGQIIVTLQLHV